MIGAGEETERLRQGRREERPMKTLPRCAVTILIYQFIYQCPVIYTLIIRTPFAVSIYT